MNKRPRLFHTALLACCFLLILVVVPVILTWREWRREQLSVALITATLHNNDWDVITLLEQGADANSRATAVHSLGQVLWERFHSRRPAAANGPTALQMLFTDDIDTPLPKRQEPVGIVQALIAHGANINVTDEYAVPVVVYAGVYRANFGENNLHCVKLLLEAGADANAETRNRMSLLLCAIRGNNLDMAQLLLSRGAKCRMAGEDIPALRAAERYENPPQMLALLKKYGYTE